MSPIIILSLGLLVAAGVLSLVRILRDGSVTDRVVGLDHGVPIAQGSYDEVSSDPNVSEAYLGRPVEAKT